MKTKYVSYFGSITKENSMITITLTDEDAIEYIQLKGLAPSTPSAPYNEENDKDTDVIPSAKSDPTVTTIISTPPPPSVPLAAAITLPLSIDKQKRMQDEIEGKHRPSSFPSAASVTPIKTAKPRLKPDNVAKPTPFDWKPWEATIISIAAEQYPSRRRIQNILNAFPKGLVTKTVLRNKLVREGIAVSKDGVLSWRKDGYDHSTRGFKSRSNR